MWGYDKMDVSQYLDIFLDESKEHLQSLSDQLMILEQEPDNMDTINEIFRAAHSLKGMAGTMGYKRMQTLTHDMENVFSEVRSGNLKVDDHMVDILFQSLDALEEYTENIQNTTEEGTNENEHLIRALNAILNGEKGGAAAAAPVAETTKEAAESTVESKWKEIKLGTTELGVLSKAVEMEKKILGITVFVQETCLLKAARAFLVFKALEDLGEIIVSDPSAQDIEDEKFDFDFSMIFISDVEQEKVLRAVKNVSEIADAKVESINLDDYKTAEIKETQETTTQVEKVEETKAQATVKQAPAKQAAGKPVVNRTVRVDIEKLDVLMNLVSELIIAKNSLVAATNNADSAIGASEHIEYLESVTTNLHESVMKVRMVPIESVVAKFPKMIRDLSKKLDKKIQLFMTGEETELDRTVVDEIGDPLMHLLRNSADHGLESSEVRKQRGKPEVGTVRLNAYQDGNNVVIEVGDDGNGIDVESVKNKAISRGTITAEQAESMTDKDIIDLLFLPSFSTAKEVSDVSGRGVGLDVVKSKIESLSGEVEVKTKLGEGSTFIIRLPLTLAIIQALMVEVGKEKYAIPLGTIQTIEDIEPGDIKYVQGKEVINLRGEVMPLIRLNEILDCESTSNSEDNLLVVIIKKGEKLAGLVVDELMGQQEIVIKSMSKYINKCKIINGATILGDGEIALIIDTNVLL